MERRSRLLFMRQWSQVGHGKKRKISQEELEGWAESLNALLLSQSKSTHTLYRHLEEQVCVPTGGMMSPSSHNSVEPICSSLRTVQPPEDSHHAFDSLILTNSERPFGWKRDSGFKPV